MQTYLDEPILDLIEQSSQDTKHFKYASCGIQGHRSSYEDKSLALVNAQQLLDESSENNNEELDIFAIYDGHWYVMFKI
jgi:hypothetical protein